MNGWMKKKRGGERKKAGERNKYLKAGRLLGFL